MDAKGMECVAGELVYFYLIRLGHKILLREYECARGQVDFISKQGGALVFTEVLVGKEKGAGRLEAIAKYYLSRYGINEVPTRFEIVRVVFKDGAEPTFTTEVAK